MSLSASGAAAGTEGARSHHAQCPGTHITVSGYSQGTIVAGDELNKLSHEQTIPHARSTACSTALRAAPA